VPVGVSAYVPLATKTLTATATSVTFSSISQVYKDLVIVIQAGATVGATITCALNADSGANYNRIFMSGGWGGVVCAAQTSVSPYFNLTANTFTNLNLTTSLVVSVFDYSLTDKHKSVLCRSDIPDGTNNGTVASALRWGSTAAVTSFTLTAGGNTFVIGSTFTLYGVAA